MKRVVIKSSMALMVSMSVWMAASVQAQQVTYVIDTGHSHVGFKVRHLVSNTRGNFKDFEGTITFDTEDFTTAKVTGTIQSASIDTDHEKRDKHLRSGDFFDTEKYPTISFKSTKIAKTGKDTYAVWGDMTMHGVTKSVKLDAEYTGMATDPWGNEKLGLTVSGEINRLDYGIKWSKTLDTGGLVVGNEVKLLLEIEANKKK